MGRSKIDFVQFAKHETAKNYLELVEMIACCRNIERQDPSLAFLEEYVSIKSVS